MNPELDVLNYIATYTYHVLNIETGWNATLPIKHIVDHFSLQYPNIRKIITLLRRKKYITGFEFPMEKPLKNNVRITSHGLKTRPPIIFERRDIKRYLFWNSKTNQPYLVEDKRMKELGEKNE